MLGPIYRAGVAGTNSLRGTAVFEVGAIEGINGGLVDMAGPGARLTIHSETINICICAEPAPGARPVDYCNALKRAALMASVLLAKTTKGLKGDDVEVFDLEGDRARLDDLPRVAYLMQLHSHGEIREPFVYGANTRSYYPTILQPGEILDGAVVCGHYNISPALKNTTYTLLNHPVIRGLYRRHGTELDFRGVVIAPEPTSLTEIARTSMFASGLLRNTLQADGVIITKEGGGHTDVDLMENCNACERLGIKTVLIDNEWLGPDGAGEFPLLASSPTADAMVSVGNADAVVRLPSYGQGHRRQQTDGRLQSGSGRRDQTSHLVHTERHKPGRLHLSVDDGEVAVIRVIHYVNQSFGQIGGEEKAGVGPRVVEGAVGPGLLIDRLLGGQGKVVATGICGDNYFAQKPETAAREVLELLSGWKADVFIAGPAFNAGRYGLACGEMCAAVTERLGIPAVTGMFADNPGVGLYRRRVIIIESDSSAAGIAEAMPKMINLARKLLKGDRLGTPAAEGYIPQGFKENVLTDSLAAERAITLLLKKMTRGRGCERDYLP